MKTLYTFYGKPYRLYRLFILLVCCAVFNFISLPDSLAQLSYNSSGNSSTLSLGSNSPSLMSRAALQLNKQQAFSSTTLYTLSSQPVLLMPVYEDTTNELSGNQASTYLLDEDPAAQTITLRLPKVDAGKILIAVYSHAGNLLMKKSVRNQEESEMEMNLKDLQAGAYFLEIQAAEIYEKVSFSLE